MEYRLTKKYFIYSLSCVAVAVILAFVLCITFGQGYFIRFGVPVMITGLIIRFIVFVHLATKRPLIFEDNQLTFSHPSNGNQETVSFSRIERIYYSGHENRIFCDDQLVVEHINGEKCRVLWGYENHYELWERIIIEAIKQSPCLRISPRTIKKMNGHWTNKEYEAIATEISKSYKKK